MPTLAVGMRRYSRVFLMPTASVGMARVKMSIMFQIKICGITNVDDALAVAQAGADAIGLNFYSRSPRYVTTDVARDILKALPAGVVKVGLFVDTPADEVCRLFDDLQLDLIQLHGDQPPSSFAIGRSAGDAGVPRRIGRTATGCRVSGPLSACWPQCPRWCF